MIYLSICYFTIATEIRFIEIDKYKQQNRAEKDKDSKQQTVIMPQTENYKISEIYHLKAIEIICKHVFAKSPYINHLITSYHKHYNNNLDVIVKKNKFV